ncbi:Acetyltransferase (GNAT) family protein [Caballeronia pedi]|uniref:Acetyltransferase (GNAT) family protein n=1 Tax=Caballeronia pedi TaxID=1777141 RepID=A0A158DRN7_9BURK|nr:GNAT family N-acetyltransferase [Caballeronia pedi]SAK97309.1 Acetyltransferase (GNAT) family protein [Caballeronia pedi]
MPTDISTVETLDIRPATDADFALLARMNRELIEDEGHRNPMTIAQLEARFRRFVSEDGYSVDLLLLDGEIAGYTTHRYEPDNAEPRGRRVFVRQFYIARGKRGGGLGRRALERLIHTRFAEGDRVFLDVMETNPGGKAFWARTGFTPYSTTMERVVRKS